MNNATEDWEQNKYVQAFLNDDKCPQNIMANAYYIRDLHFNIDFVTAKQNALKKLSTIEHRVELDKIEDHKSFYQALTVEELSYLGW